MTPLRRTVARRLVEAQQTAAILTTFNEVDMSRVLALRERHGEAFLARHGVKLGFMSFFVKAAVEALRAFPAVNAEVRGTDVVYKDHYDIGVAVGGGKGLVVPVIRDADRKSVQQIATDRADLVTRARDGKLKLDDLEGGTFTVSNLGMYGIEQFIAVLNPPQVAILAVGSIEDRARVAGAELVVSPTMTMTLTCDHRAIDGSEGAEFLRDLKTFVEAPALAL
jgi:2-oxoglutarate dehydrogenase E2 component (dihydrolipoamide succinyltransferase)